MKKIATFILALLLAAALFSQAQKVDYAMLGMEAVNGHMPDGLNEGDKAPDFTGYDQSGKQVTLKNYLAKGPVVLFFYRGNWCPACNKQLQVYQDSLSMISGQDVTLVAITPESIEKVEATVKAHNIAYPVIYDCQEKIMQDYDVMFTVSKAFQDRIMSSFKVNIAAHNGHEVAHLPVAATYIINKAGYITAVYFNPDFHNRAPVNWILRNLGSAL